VSRLQIALVLLAIRTGARRPPLASAEADEGIIYKPGAQYRFYSEPWSEEAGLDLKALKPAETGTINVGTGSDSARSAAPGAGPDLDALTPRETRSNNLGKTKDSARPGVSGDSFVVVDGLIKCGQAGQYRFRPRERDSSFNVMTVRDQKVYRKDLADEEAVQAAISLAEGYHPFRIVFFKTSNPFTIWHELGDSGQYARMSPEHFWHGVRPDKAIKTDLLGALAALKRHVKGEAELDAKQIEAHKLTIDKHRELFGYNETVIKACLDLVTTYDDVKGPLWIAHRGLRRGANDLHWTIYTVMQNIMDRVYTGENLARYPDLLGGFKFGCSAQFPGAVEPPVDPNAAYRVKVNAGCPKPFKHRIMHEEVPARRPTGAYLAPGTIATVTVPPSLVGKGYGVRVGAHSWDNSRKPAALRLDRSSLVYPIDRAEVKVASPLGGGIYIDVPLRAEGSVVEVAIRNTVRSPHFSMKPFHRTALEEWRNVERKHKAPWADFQTEKFMMQVPTSWITKLEDPVALMQDWDKAMDALNDLMGLPHVWGKETMYLQVDLQNRSRVLAPGYPTCNDRYHPKRQYDGYVNHYLVRGPQHAPGHVFHEQGHGFFFVKFGGEMESTVNLLHVPVWHRKFGYSLDKAFAASRGYHGNEHRTLDNTAVAWMTSFSFAAKRPMHAGEKAYQLKDHAKFVDIARLFGWEVLGDFWRSWVVDFEEGRPWSKHGMGTEKLALRLSEVSGLDMRPLLHFWGTPTPHVLVLSRSQAEVEKVVKEAQAKVEKATAELDAAKAAAKEDLGEATRDDLLEDPQEGPKEDLEVDPQAEPREDPVKKAMDKIAKATADLEKAQEDLGNAKKAAADRHRQLPGAKEYARKYAELLEAGKLKRSATIYDQLMKYKALVPKDNAAFRDFARKWWGRPPSSKGFWTEREHTKQWDGLNEETAARIRSTVQWIIDLYFSDGRPGEESH